MLVIVFWTLWTSLHHQYTSPKGKIWDITNSVASQRLMKQKDMQMTYSTPPPREVREWTVLLITGDVGDTPQVDYLVTTFDRDSLEDIFVGWNKNRLIYLFLCSWVSFFQKGIEIE